MKNTDKRLERRKHEEFAQRENRLAKTRISNFISLGPNAGQDFDANLTDFHLGATYHFIVLKLQRKILNTTTDISGARILGVNQTPVTVKTILGLIHTNFSLYKSNVNSELLVSFKGLPLSL